MYLSPLNQLGLLCFGLRCVEAPLALLKKERKVGCWYTVEAAQMSLGLVPEVLDAVDVVFLVGEEFGVVDPGVPEGGDIEHVVGTEGVGIDDAVGHDLDVEDGFERLALHVGDHLGIDLATAF